VVRRTSGWFTTSHGWMLFYYAAIDWWCLALVQSVAILLNVKVAEVSL